MTIEGSIEGLKLTEFFLVLSSTGLAWIGVSLMRQTSRKKNAAVL